MTIASVFISAYTLSSLYLIYDVTKKQKYNFWNCFIRMTFQSLSSFLPITCVLCTHMKNVSAGKFIKTALLSLIAKTKMSNDTTYTQSDDRGTVVNNEMLHLISEMSEEDELNASNLIQLQRLSNNLRLIISHNMSNTSGLNLLASNSPVVLKEYNLLATNPQTLKRSNSVFQSVSRDVDMGISVSSAIQEEEFELSEENSGQMKKSKTLSFQG